jgi:hypothetical protein
MKPLIFTCLLFSFSAFAETPKPIDLDVSFNEKTFETQPWTKEFHYVIVVNKATAGKEAQTIKIFEYGQLIMNDKVSTGRDVFESKGTHNSTMDSWSVTPTGYYTPTFLDKDHKSDAYKGKWSWIIGGVKMPYAIFFNGGIALHERPRGTESMLGKNASGGCVRLPDTLASDLFTRVGETIGARNPKFEVNGYPKLDAGGTVLHETQTGFSTLIVVQNKII